MSADAWIVGLHLLSVHIPSYQYGNDHNYGLYVRAPSGATVGGFRNTIGRTSFYGGWTFTLDTGILNTEVDLTAGFITGYKRECTESVCRGYSPGALAPLLAPSVSWPNRSGFSPRITFLPAVAERSAVIHLSIERTL